MVEAQQPKRLNVQIQLGGITFRFKASEVQQKNNPKHPDFKGLNIAVWINQDVAVTQNNDAGNNSSESVQVL